MGRNVMTKILEGEGLTVKVKPEDLPKNRLGPEVSTLFRRKTRFDDSAADFARGKSRREKHKKPWADRSSSDLRSFLSSEGLTE